MRISLDSGSVEDYAKFLRAKSLPKYRVFGSFAEFPDEYAAEFGATQGDAERRDYRPSKWLFDHQAAIARIAVAKKRYAVFADCGLGKTAIMLEVARGRQQGWRPCPRSARACAITPCGCTNWRERRRRRCG